MGPQLLDSSLQIRDLFFPFVFHMVSSMYFIIKKLIREMKMVEGTMN